MSAALEGCASGSKCKGIKIPLNSPESWWYCRPLPRDGGMEEFCGVPTISLRPKVWTRGQNGRSSGKDGAPERFRGGTIQKEVS